MPRCRQRPLVPFQPLTIAQVSKHLHTMLSNRNVWCKILRETCIKESHFKPSYPLNDMTLEEIQRASLAPSRWRSRISSEIIQTDLETFYASLKPPRGRPKPPEIFHSAFPIPGGRYVISVNDTPEIYVLDLGVNGKLLSKKKWKTHHIPEPRFCPWLTSFAVAPLGESVVRVVMWAKEHDVWLYVSLPTSMTTLSAVMSLICLSDFLSPIFHGSLGPRLSSSAGPSKYASTPLTLILKFGGSSFPRTSSSSTARTTTSLSSTPLMDHMTPGRWNHC